MRSLFWIIIIALTFACSTPSSAGGFYRWTQYTPDGIEARAAIPGASALSCPHLSVDGADAPMKVRAAPGDNYPVTICAGSIPPGAQRALINDLPLPLPKPRANRVLVIGDTGCRLKVGMEPQSCNSLGQWPFKLGADMAAFEEPDVVIHVGDYHYRESACPLGNYGCSGTPYGDNWEAWRADFFSPAESLLDAAPWVFIRGNDEICKRGGKGWARTLSPAPFDPRRGEQGCLPAEEPFVADIGGVEILAMDVSAADEIENPEQVEAYGRQFSLAAKSPVPVWIAMHRPPFADEAPAQSSHRGDNKTLAAALRANMTPQVTMILSGHHHTFEAMEFGPDLPLQIVSGHGGDSLSPFAPKEVKGLTINGATVAEGVARPGVFGFAILERAAENMMSGEIWTLTAYDARAEMIARCRVDARRLQCE